MAQRWAAAAAINGLLAVACGAFGAHALKERLSPEDMMVFETGARYQMYHTVALLAVGWVGGQSRSRWARVAGWCFVAGIVLFSGSLYALVLSGTRFWGAVTPIGGVSLMVGWALLARAALGVARVEGKND